MHTMFEKLSGSGSGGQPIQTDIKNQLMVRLSLVGIPIDNSLEMQTKQTNLKNWLKRKIKNLCEIR